MKNSRNKRKFDEADIEDATSALRNLSLSSNKVATQNYKRSNKTRSRQTKTQSQIRRRGSSSGEHHKSHPKDLSLWTSIEQNVSAMLTSIRESMSKKGSKSAGAQSHKETKSEKKSRKRQRFTDPVETSKRTKSECNTRSNLVDELVLRFSRITLKP